MKHLQRLTLALLLTLCAATQIYAFDTINLWPSTPPGDKAESYQDKGGSYYTPRMEYWRPANQTSDACLIICCGGSYMGVAYEVEGIMPRDFFVEHGVTVVMLWYRTPRRPGIAKHYAAWQDVQRAIRIVRAHADEWKINPDKIGVMGFSAGGHLVASTMCLYAHLAMGISEDAALHPPRAIALGYPVITFETGSTHEGSFQALTGGQEYLRSRLSVENMLPEGGAFPAAYVFACEDDETVPPENARILKRALDDRGIPCSLRLFPQGGHGCGLGFATSAFSWSGEMLDFFDRQLAAKGRDTIPTRESK